MDPFTEGYHAGLATVPLRINAECPHADGTDAATAWWRGWLKGEHEVMAASPAALVIAGEVGFPVLFMPDWPESRKAVVQEWIANCSDAALLAHLDATRRSMEILDGDLEDVRDDGLSRQARSPT
jgi:hypothetical protein